MIKWMFEVCIGMLKSLHKIKHVSVELLSDQDYAKLKILASSKAEEIIKQVFKQERVIEKRFFLNALEVLEL